MSAISRSGVTIVVIAKEPVIGRVKTRLCPPCSPAQAADIARASLADTVDTVAKADVGRRAIALEGQAGDWLPSGFDVFAQCGGGLDRRLAAAVSEIDGPVVIVGMDTPQVTVQLLDEVVSGLCVGGTDAVLGFAEDGGYWVIALRENRPDALLGVPMSTSTTGRAQLERLESLGLRTALVPTLCDVDTFDDALRVKKLVPASRFAHSVERVIESRMVAADSSKELRHG